MATKTAVAGKYQSRTGEDFIQYVDNYGKVVHRVEKDGTIHAAMIIFPDGSTQATATSGSLNPGSDVDAGTF